MNFIAMNKNLYKNFIGIFSLALFFALSGCSPRNSIVGEVINEGYVLDSDALGSVTLGSSREQVLLSLGSPSLPSIYGDKVYYYISQTRYQALAFLKPRIIDRSILAIYFTNDDTVKQIARYGLKDGRVFDYISRTTPITGRDKNFIKEILSNTSFVPISITR